MNCFSHFDDLEVDDDEVSFDLHYVTDADHPDCETLTAGVIRLKRGQDLPFTLAHDYNSDDVSVKIRGLSNLDKHLKSKNVYIIFNKETVTN